MGVGMKIEFRAEKATGWHILPALSIYWSIGRHGKRVPGRYWFSAGILCFNFRLRIYFNKSEDYKNE
jgi:hypothetical protein